MRRLITGRRGRGGGGGEGARPGPSNPRLEAMRTPLGTATSARRTAPSLDEDLLLRGFSASTRRLPLSMYGTPSGAELMQGEGSRPGQAGGAELAAQHCPDEADSGRFEAVFKTPTVRPDSRLIRTAPRAAGTVSCRPQAGTAPGGRLWPPRPHGCPTCRADQPRCWGCGPRVAQQAQSARRRTGPAATVPPRCGGQSAARQEPEHRRPRRAVHLRRSAGGRAAHRERLAAAHAATGTSRYTSQLPVYPC